MIHIGRHALPAGCLPAAIALGAGLLAWSVREPAAAVLWEHPYFTLHELIISGYGPALTPEDIREWLGVTGGTTVWQASPTRARARLEAHPRIARAAVRREFPGRLELVVRERRPQAIAVLDDLYYVDRGGGLFGPLTEADSRDYPIITGLTPELPAGFRTWALRRALRILRRCGRGPCFGELSEVHLDPQRGLVVYPAAVRVPVILGWGSWPAKLERAQRALDAWKGATARLAGVDVRFRNQVVVMTRPSPPPVLRRPGRPGAPGLQA